MPRARNIKPGFFANEDLAELPFETRLLFIGLWTLADREGRMEDRPKRIKMALFPGDDVAVEKGLSSLEKSGFLLRYTVDEVAYIAILNFAKHQKPHHMEVASVIPPPPGKANRYTHEPIRREQRARILERDGHKCTRCGATERLQIDHIVPVSKGGGSVDLNLSTLCARCNMAKGNRNAQAVDDSSTVRAQVVEGGVNPSDS
jgi:hypothetical protein